MTPDEHIELLKKRYPNPNDPRRDPDFGTRTVESEIKQLLGAVLTALYSIQEQLEFMSDEIRHR